MGLVSKVLSRTGRQALESMLEGGRGLENRSSQREAGDVLRRSRGLVYLKLPQAIHPAVA